MKFSIKDFFSKCDQTRRKLWIWSHLLKNALMKNFIFCAVLLSVEGLRFRHLYFLSNCFIIVSQLVLLNSQHFLKHCKIAWQRFKANFTFNQKKKKMTVSDLVPSVQFKKHENCLWRSVTL